jgi:uncharacterized protein with gpF-like domain
VIERATVEAVDLPFAEAIRFFTEKVNTPTRRWTDLWEAAHARAFSVAGAMRDALLDDFRREIAKALEQGTTLEEFRGSFDEIVKKHGWKHTGAPAPAPAGSGSGSGEPGKPGAPGWRARIIYETNLSMAFSAGRHAQMTDPDVLAAYPYWRYRHSGALHPRLQHLAWDGLTLAASDSFWSWAWPPNGFNCGCYVEPVSTRGLRRERRGLDASPPPEPQPYLDRKTGQWKTTPKGIDPGFGYNVGEAWRGRPDFRAVPPAPPAPPLGGSGSRNGEPGKPGAPAPEIGARR